MYRVWKIILISVVGVIAVLVALFFLKHRSSPPQLKDFKSLKEVAARVALDFKNKDYKDAYKYTSQDFQDKVPLDNFVKFYKAQDDEFNVRGDRVEDVQLVEDNEFLADNKISSLEDVKNLDSAQYGFRNTWFVKGLDLGEDTLAHAVIIKIFSFKDGRWCDMLDSSQFLD